MKKKWIAMAASAAALAASAAVLAGVGSSGEEPPAAAASAVSPAATGRVLLAVEGVSCGSCEGRIQEALGADAAVRAVSVDLAARTVTVDYMEGQVDPKALAERVTRLGYPARFLASGPAVPPPAVTAAKAGSGCGGTCCASRQ